VNSISEFADVHQQILFVGRVRSVHPRLVTTCPECKGAGFVVGDESASRVRCLSCGGSGQQTADGAHTPALATSARESRATPVVALKDDPQLAR
jgi:DnaJ-class molecular chaperone